MKKLLSIILCGLGLTAFAQYKPNYYDTNSNPAISLLGLTIVTNVFDSLITNTASSNYIASLVASNTPTLVQVTAAGNSTTNNIITTKTNSAAYFYGNGVGLTNVGGIKYYRALLNQTGTNDPVATVSYNTLGGTVVWHRYQTGGYDGTLTGGFPIGKTTIFIQNTTLAMMVNTYPNGDGDRVSIDTLKFDPGILGVALPGWVLSDGDPDNILADSSVQIIVDP